MNSFFFLLQTNKYGGGLTVEVSKCRQRSFVNVSVDLGNNVVEGITFAAVCNDDTGDVVVMDIPSGIWMDYYNASILIAVYGFNLADGKQTFQVCDARVLIICDHFSEDIEQTRK